jgi:hypothetical protein
MPPAAGTTIWSVENMIHEVGLPVPKDPDNRSIADWINKHWKKLYNTQVTENLVRSNFADWVSLRTRTHLNERDSLFGIAYRTRPRVSESKGGNPLLRLSLRRTSEATLDQFLERLTFGTPPLGLNPFQIGQTWLKNNKDADLICFICLCDIGAGEARPGFRAPTGYFTASTGYERIASVVNAANGHDIATLPLNSPKAPYNGTMLASLVAHECGHQFELGDEYGPGTGANFGGSSVTFANLQPKSAIMSGTVLDPTLIKWAFPRTIKIGRVASKPVPQGGFDFQFKLMPGSNPFARDDLVLIREAPLRKSDPYLHHRFKVVGVFTVGGNAVDVTQQNAPPLDPDLFDPSKVYVLICTNIKPGPELKLIAEPVLTHIRTSNAPLTGATCVATANQQSVMLPTNLPTAPPLSFYKPPPSMADVVGIYEGGGHVDCDIFRPAGRCKMRTADDFGLLTALAKVDPFCQVCRYIIVDRVDAMKLVDLDRMYAPHYPK